MRTNDLLRKNFCALFAFIMTVGAQYFSITLVAVGIGVVLDRLRNRFGANYDEIIKRFDEAGGDLRVVRQRGRILLPILYSTWAIYVVVFFSFELVLSDAAIRNYLESWRGLHELTMILFYMPRHQFADMVAQGYEYRALVTLHAYSIANLFMILIAMLWIWLGGYPNASWNMKHFYLPVRNGTLKRPVRSFSAIGLLAIFSILYLILTLVPVDFDPDSRRDWVPHISNAPLLIYQGLCAVFALAQATTLTTADLVVIWLRHRADGTNTTVVSKS
jgi:hypothetical protein